MKVFAKLIPLAAALLFVSGGAWAQAYRSDAVARLAESLKGFAAAQHRPVLTTALGNISYQNTGFASAFSRWGEELFSEALAAAGGRFRIFASKSFKNFDPDFQKEYAGLFKSGSPDAMLVGMYFDEPKRVRLLADLIDLHDGTLLGRQVILLPKAELPAGLELVPPRLEAAMKILGEVKELIADSSSDLVVRASTSRGAAAAYRDGENLEIAFFTNKDAYVKLYHIDVNGKMQLIFPNKYHGNNLVPGNTVVTIPGPGYPFKFKLTPPYGAEFIKLAASTVQFKDVETAFKELGPAGKGALTRGLIMEGVENGGEASEALVAYSIVGP